MKSMFLKNISFVFVANTICILINITVNFIIPILFNQESYAYYQLENLYCSYIWIISLGLHEGIYLHYGGKTEDEINKNEIATQFWLFTGYLILVSTVVCVSGVLIMPDNDKQFVLTFSAVSVVFEALRCIYLYYLICVNNMQKYSVYLIADRVLYIFFVLILCFAGTTDYRLLIGADILSKFIMLLFIIIRNYTFFFRKLIPVKNALTQSKKLISSGINITFSNFVSGMTKGTMRFAVEAYWGVLVFGKISLTLSVSNMFTQFIQSVSIALFPVLRRLSDIDRKSIYAYLSDALDAMMLFAFLFYLPAVKILRYMLPQYSDGLRYMAILLPLSLYDARNAVINSTYLKTLHKERDILVSNLITTLCSFIFAFLSVNVCHNLDMAVISLVLLVIIRNIINEYRLSRYINIQFFRNFIYEIVLTMIFIIGNWVIGDLYGTLFYLLSFVLYMWLKRKNLKALLLYLKDVYR